MNVSRCHAPASLAAIAVLAMPAASTAETIRIGLPKVFDVAALIAYCSTFTELVPGDVIVTGTTGGVGAYRTPPLWMKDGDMVEVEVSGIGVLRNPVKDEVAAAATRAA